MDENSMEISTISSHVHHANVAGGGEMGRLTRQYDWSSTPLGGIECWPVSLLTTVGIVLHSKFPMFLFWGPEHICFYNDSYRPSLGNNGKHPFALGKKGREVWPEIWPDIQPLIQQVLSGEEAAWSEDQLLPIYRNGQMEDVYWTFSYSPVYDEAGHPAGVFVTCVETTTKVATFNKLKISEQRFQNLISQTPVGMIVLTGEEMIVEIVNDAYGTLINRDYRQLPGKPLFDVIPETKPYFHHIIEGVFKTGEPVYLYDYPYFIYTGNEKKEGYLNLVYQPYKDEEGRQIGVMVLCHNVTEQVLARQRLEVAEERARLAINSAELGVYEVNPSSSKLEGDARFYEILGLDPNDNWLDIEPVIHPEDRQQRKKALETAMQTGLLDYQARIIKKAASVHWIRVKGKVLFNKEGQPVKLIGVVQDITEQQEFAEELERKVQERTRELAEANMQLKDSNTELNQFAFVASHDLQEPLRKVKTFTGLLEQGLPEVPDKTKAHIQKIKDSTERMQTLIYDVLKFSQLSKEREKFEAVDLNAVLKAVLGDYELLIAQKEASVSADVLPVLQAITLQMNQLFTNLISNALKFRSDERKLHISISARQLTKEEVQQHADLDAALRHHAIEFKDNGIGFNQEYAKQIFIIFQRLHSRSKYEGTGIGLALCKKIILNHHGAIYADSIPGQGTAFTIILPEMQVVATINEPPE